MKLECTVATVNVAASPVSGTRAALIRWSLLEQSTVRDSRGGAPTATKYEPLAMGVFGHQELLFDAKGLSIEVPLARARFALIEDFDDAQLLDRIPEELADVVARLHPDGPIAYREATLSHGDVVELTATLARVPRSTDYRSSARPGADLRALADERILIRDLTRTHGH